VDDDAVNRQAMRLLLEREGHEVVAVENGLEAIERLGPASDRFDAVVTDLQMPRLGGRALYEQLREQRPSWPSASSSSRATGRATRRAASSRSAASPR